MAFTVIGFSQNGNIRQFLFERSAGHNTHTRYTVDANLVPLRTFGISVQELPLMCRRLLEALPEGDGTRALTLGEDDMRRHAEAAEAVLEQARRKRASAFNGARRPGQPSTFGQMRTSMAPAAAAPQSAPDIRKV